MATKIKIPLLITERFALSALVQLQALPDFEVLHDTQWFKLSREELARFEILVIRSGTKINRENLERFPHLKFIVSGTAGFDHIDLQECQKRKIQVSHCPSAHTDSAVELTWALVLACARRLHESHQAVIKGDWDRQKLMGLELSGKTYGVVGLGRIGQRVGHIAKAFGMKLLVHDPYQEDLAFEQLQVERSSLEEVLSQADVLSLHVPLTRETHHLLGEEFLQSLHPNCVLINTSRGSVIHEKALVHALKNERIKYVGLDVFEYEPVVKNSALFQFSSMAFTPHLGASTREAFEKASKECLTKILEFHRGGPIADLLPPNVAWYKEASALHNS